MLTIFSIPKPFNGQTGVIQRNAIQSWMKLRPEMEIVLCGDEFGVSEVATEFNLHHLPMIEKNEFGTPMVSSAFKMVQQFSSKSTLCYVNCDIIFLHSLIEAVQKVRFSRFLIIGQRWNLDLGDPIDFSNENWDTTLLKMVNEKGKIQPPFGSDYFIFPKEIDWNMPEFAVGRPGWDTWLIYKARSEQVPVIDATIFGIVVHQNHNYAHIPCGMNINSYEGPEAQVNRSVLNEAESVFGVRDSTHYITEDGVRKAIDIKYLKYRVSHQEALNPFTGYLSKYTRRMMQTLLKIRKLFPQQFLERTIYLLTK